MPIPNVNLIIGLDKAVVIRSHPKDANGQLPSGMSNVTWAIDTDASGILSAPFGWFNQDIQFQLKDTPSAGVTTITMACQGKVAQYTVTATTLPAPGPIDHFEPTNDPPTQ